MIATSSHNETQRRNLRNSNICNTVHQSVCTLYSKKSPKNHWNDARQTPFGVKLKPTMDMQKKQTTEKSTKEKYMLHTNKFVKLEKTTYQRRLRTCEGPESVLDAGQELWQETAARRFHSSPPGALAAWPQPPWWCRPQLTSTGFHSRRRLNVLHRLSLSYKEQTQGFIAFRTLIKDRFVLHIFLCDPGSTDTAVLKQIITVCYISTLPLPLFLPL